MQVALIAVAITIGPIGWGLLAIRVFKFAFFTMGLSFAEANAISVGFIAFPFFLAATWVLLNMEKWERLLKRVTGA